MRQDRIRPAAPQHSTAGLVHQPFRALDRVPVKHTRTPQVSARPAPVQTEPVVPEPDSAALFLRAVADVTPLHGRARERVATPVPASPARAMADSDAEALAELSDLVSGSAPFDVAQSDEHIEGVVVGLDPRLLRRLRAGEFAYQGHLDLHGLTTETARLAVESFLTRAHQAGKRCVLIVHGRGHNSKDQIPVLKSRVTHWLARGQWARLILAFTSARPCDGGAGALYVLLRRQRHTRQPIRVTNGAKW